MQRATRALRVGKIDCTAGFAAALCVLRLVAEPDVCAAFLAAAAAHEAGHLLTLRLLGADILSVRLGFLDAQIRSSALGYREEAVSAIAGPAASVLLCGLFRTLAPTFAAISLLLGLFNALPVFPLDGGRALRAGLGLILPLETAQKVCWIVSAAFLAAGLAAALLGAWNYGLGLGPVFVWSTVLVRVACYAGEEGLAIEGHVGYNTKDYE